MFEWVEVFQLDRTKERCVTTFSVLVPLIRAKTCKWFTHYIQHTFRQKWMKTTQMSFFSSKSRISFKTNKCELFPFKFKIHRKSLHHRISRSFAGFRCTLSLWISLYNSAQVIICNIFHIGSYLLSAYVRFECALHLIYSVHRVVHSQ